MIDLQVAIDRVVSVIWMPDDQRKRQHVLKLISGMLTRLPRPSGGAPVHGSRPSMSAEAVAQKIEAWGFNNWNMPLAWVARDGFVMPASDFRHEYVLHFLGLDIACVEDQGWARISKTQWQCLYRLSPEQKRSLVARGCLIDKDAERLKKLWHGLPPYDESVPQAYRTPR